MFIHGTYSLWRKIVGFRNDYCLGCAAPRVAFRYRTFDVLHIHFIPLLPLGFWKRWRCGTCNRDPHAHARTRKGFKWAGTLLLALFAAAVWSVPRSELGDSTEDLLWIWALRLTLAALFALALWKTIQSPPDPVEVG